jgi:tyrosine-protein phosphatase YwqE
MLRFGPDQRWLLVELSTSVEADGVDTAVDECGRQGLRLVLAHVARYGYLHGRSGTTRLEAWRDAGALLQVNLGSLVGQYGRAVQRQARLLHRRGLIDLLGTDIHQPRQLGHLRSAMDWLTGRGGIQTSAHRELAERHPAAS